MVEGLVDVDGRVVVDGRVTVEGRVSVEDRFVEDDAFVDFDLRGIEDWERRLFCVGGCFMGDKGDLIVGVGAWMILKPVRERASFTGRGERLNSGFLLALYRKDDTEGQTRDDALSF
jgi:hypothetical protein